MTGFVIDPRLAADSTNVGHLPLCNVRLMNDANYPWLLLIPRRAKLVEIFDLDPPDRETLAQEIAEAAAALKEITGCEKTNVATLGNLVSQFHVHVIARFAGDPAWPGPVWGKVPPVEWQAEARDRLINALSIQLLDGEGA